MLFYYPLEQMSYLGYHGVIPTSFTSPLSVFSSKKKKITINPDVLSLWSCRFWAVYVILHIFHLIEDRKLLHRRHALIRKEKGLSKEEKEEMAQRWDAFWSEVVTNLGYLPLTIHWCALSFTEMQCTHLVIRRRSSESGLFKNEVCIGSKWLRGFLMLGQAWIGVFGLIAAVSSFRSGWKATALPSPALLASTKQMEGAVEELSPPEAS
jgi:RNAse (barnase) inhibitor barstar